ncbi:MAG: VIT1/CCC1 transporter family protein [Acidobacteriota bacterium]|nr:VIT1/CCC1 transporter family protein [Acidobacteriota bacterium]
MPAREDAEVQEAIRLLQQNWREEKESARVYRELSQDAKDERRRGILFRMAEAEERHAARWEQKLRDLGSGPPDLTDTLARRWNRWLNRRAGLDAAVRRLEAAEDRDTAKYEAQQKILERDEEAQSALKEIAVEEKAHARVLQSLAPQLGPQTILDVILKRERWHGRGGSWVADAIYGVNDGLGAVFGIVSGVAGATGNQQHYVLVAGLAGMLASALSMGAGAYLAVKSEREVYEAEISRERQEIEENPEEEKEELALFYELQGFGTEESRRMAETVAQAPEQMLRTMAQAELGLSERHFPNPWISSLSAGVSTAVGAFIPIIPFFFIGGFEAVAIAFGISILAHFAVGAAKTILTTRKWWASGLEMTLVGILEAVVTYGLGLAFGAVG